MTDDINDDIDALIDELNASAGPARIGHSVLRVETMLAEVVRRHGSWPLISAIRTLASTCTPLPDGCACAGST